MSAKPCSAPPEDRVAYAYGELTPEQAAAFEAHLQTCQACRAEVADLKDAAALVAQVREAPVPEPVWTKPFEIERSAARMPWWKRPLWIGLPAAAAAVLVWLVVLVNEPAPKPKPPTADPVAPSLAPLPAEPAKVLAGLRVLAAKGQVQVQRAGQEGKRTLSADDELMVGERVSTSDAAWAVMELEDGSRVRLGARSRLMLVAGGPHGDRFELEQGAIACRVQPRQSERAFEVSAGPGQVRVVGTRFAVRLLPNGTLTVGVEKGSVRVGPKAAQPESVLLKADQQARMAPGKDIKISRLGHRLRNLMSPLRPAQAPKTIAKLTPDPTEIPPVPKQPTPKRPQPKKLEDVKPIADRIRERKDTLEELVARLYQDTAWIFDDLRAELARGKCETVLRKLENYLSDPDSPGRDEATFLKAVCLEQLGKKRAAMQAYQHYRMNWPSGKRAADCRSSMRRIRRGK
jgi:ferric-dicitrate binding protein FerR (iron transport regulator)